ncbi:hypothetical protein AAVH_43097, partial [Aphelenchoides avenae]
FEVAPSGAMKELFPDVRVVHCQFHLAQNLLRHIREKGLTDVYRDDEDGYEALVAALNVLNNREVLPLDRFPALIRNYIRRINRRGVFTAPLFPPRSWNVNEAVAEDGARTNDSQKGWNRGFNARFQHSMGKLSKFLLRPQEDEDQTRQLLGRSFGSVPGRTSRGRRRRKTVIRGGQVRNMVVEYNALAAVDRTAEAKLELLRRIQFHLTA